MTSLVVSASKRYRASLSRNALSALRASLTSNKVPKSELTFDASSSSQRPPTGHVTDIAVRRHDPRGDFEGALCQDRLFNGFNGLLRDRPT